LRQFLLLRGEAGLLDLGPIIFRKELGGVDGGDARLLGHERTEPGEPKAGDQEGARQ
jgi:hypothetical protein